MLVDDDEDDEDEDDDNENVNNNNNMLIVAWLAKPCGCSTLKISV
jgi:hypothetical protein